MQSTPNPPLSRRRFLHQSSVAAAAVVGFPHLLSPRARGAGQANPVDKVSIGFIGTGGRGLGVLKEFLVEAKARVVAVCDGKADRLAAGRQAVNAAYGNQDCAVYSDFRDVIGRRDIEAVVVAAPDHWHVPMAIAAVRAGKDVFVEKPLGLAIGENQALRAALRKHERVFQFGTQQRSSANFRLACELVRNERIGRLEHIKVWSVGSVPGGPTAPAPVPPGLDFDFWLGPAPAKPYREHLCDANGTTKTWWFNSDYALGFIAGWGVHPMDIAYWGCPELMSGPLEVKGTGKFPTEGACDTATEWLVNMKSAAGVTLEFHGLPIGDNSEALKKHNPWQERYARTTHHGTVFEGTDGWIIVDRSHIGASSPSVLKENPDDFRVKLTRSKFHAENFVDSVRSRRPAVANIDEAFQSDALCHLSNLALRTGRTLTWDPTKERFVNDDAANRLLVAREPRKPWTL